MISFGRGGRGLIEGYKFPQVAENGHRGSSYPHYVQFYCQNVNSREHIHNNFGGAFYSKIHRLNIYHVHP